MNMLLEELLGKPPDTAIIYEDNMGCIFLVKNQSIGQRTKHIDIRHHFVRDLYEEGRVEPRFVRTEVQYADGFTKSLPEAVFRRHMDVIRFENLECSRENDESSDGGRTDQ